MRQRRGIRHWAWTGLVIFSLAAAPAGTARPAAVQPAATYHQRADTAVQSFLQKYWNPSRNYLNAAYPSDGRLASYWAYANGWQAVIDNVGRTHRHKYDGWIETLYNGQNARGWSAAYYDDENWMVLALPHAYSVTRDSNVSAAGGGAVLGYRERLGHVLLGEQPGRDLVG